MAGPTDTPGNGEEPPRNNGDHDEDWRDLFAVLLVIALSLLAINSLQNAQHIWSQRHHVVMTRSAAAAGTVAGAGQTVPSAGVTPGTTTPGNTSQGSLVCDPNHPPATLAGALLCFAAALGDHVGRTLAG